MTLGGDYVLRTTCSDIETTLYFATKKYTELTEMTIGVINFTVKQPRYNIRTRTLYATDLGIISSAV
jgi:hypothetical protein